MTGRKEHLTSIDQISIDKYVDDRRKEWIRINERNKLSNPPIPLNYNQFCQLIIAHGSNFLAKKGEEKPFVIDKSNEYAISQIYKYLRRDNSFNGSLSKGILLNGRYGSGKTVLMNAVRETYNVCVDHWGNTDILKMRIVKSSQIVNSFRKEDNDIEISNYSSGILIIDELGREQKEVNIYGTILQPMAQVIQDRYDRGKQTFAICNFKLETLGSDEYYGKMIGDRIRQMFNELELSGESRRN